MTVLIWSRRGRCHTLFCEDAYIPADQRIRGSVQEAVAQKRPPHDCLTADESAEYASEAGELDPRDHAVLADWTSKEKALRTLFNYTGCVLASERCKPESVIACDACSSESEARPW